MIAFLINRPIGVMVTTLGFIIMGIVAFQLLPISLMPDIEIPEITIQVKGKNQSAIELEEVLVGPLRRELLQVSGLQDIESQTRTNVGILKLRFEYGTSIDYAFLDVNEHVDAILSHLPQTVDRPTIIKASATDLPVFYLNLSFRDDHPQKDPTEDHLQLSDFAAEVIKKRIEQLPEVALVDITGRLYPEIQIDTDQAQMQSLGMDYTHIQQALADNNINPGNLIVQEGSYQYNLRFSTQLQTREDIEQIYVRTKDRIIQLKDIATVSLTPQSPNGTYISDGKDAIGLVIIKKADARMSALEQKVNRLIKHFQMEYPEIEFTVSQDQTKLLDYSIESLKQSLLWGGSLAFLILFFFIKDYRAPWLISLTIPISILFSLLIFYLLNISINIISLSGLILGVGLMIDNAIIVIDNISQYRSRGLSIDLACINGTNEIIRPLISSALTTSSVFLPLVFLSGISGALFLDQALAIIIGLGSSLLSSMIVLPTLYKIFYAQQTEPPALVVNKSPNLVKIYDWGLTWCFNHTRIFLTLLMILGIIGMGLYTKLPITRLPQIKQSELVIQLDWNEPINIASQKIRVKQLLQDLAPFYIHSNAELGTQQFLLQPEKTKTTSELKIWFQANNPDQLHVLKDTINKWFSFNYPLVPYEVSTPKNLFERIFSDQSPPLVIHLSQKGPSAIPTVDQVKPILSELRQKTARPLPDIPHLTYRVIEVDMERIVLYKIDINTLFQTLKTRFRIREIGTLQKGAMEIPIILNGEKQKINSIIQQTKVKNEDGQFIPVSSLVRLKTREDYQSITGGKTGNYIPIPIDITEDELPRYQQIIQSLELDKKGINYQLKGTLFGSKKQLVHLVWVMIIAWLMLYFILAAQFESLLQPLIVILEIPFDLAAAIIFLWLAGMTLNLMSMIGMIVMSGIIINDSILKIDTINRLRAKGYTLKDAVKEAGIRRLNPIIMTSLTTILAVIPFLFSEGMGADLQKPLAWALIGGMLIGTLVSLYFIPLAYHFLYRKQLKTDQK
jgi:multidrug efflux pump subunit AcrB